MEQEDVYLIQLIQYLMSGQPRNAAQYANFVVITDRNNFVTLAIQVTQFLELLFESTLMLVLSTETKTEWNNWK